MKKYFLFIFIAAITMPLLLFSINVHAEGIEDLSFPGNFDNLLDPEILEYDNNFTITSNKLTYLAYNEVPLSFQVESKYLISSGYISLEVYDSSFCMLGIIDSSDFQIIEGQNGIEWAITTLYIEEEVFAFRIRSFNDLSIDFETDGFPVMCFVGDEIKELFYEFRETQGFYDLSIDNHPTIETSYTNVLTDEEIESLIQAYDGYQGNITHLLVFNTDDYKNNATTIGTYTVYAEVTDSNENTANGYFYIEVTDRISPSIFGLNELSFEVNTDISDELIIGNYTANDGYDGDVTSSLRVVGNYTLKPSSVFFEMIQIEASDSHGNKSYFPVKLNYVDNTKPLITGPTKLQTSYQILLEEKDIVDRYVVTDNVDTNLTILVINNGYKNNERTVGSYQVTLYSIDNSDNEATLNIEIEVEDNIAPIIVLNSYILEVTDSIALKNVDFIDLMYASGELESSKSYNAKVLKDTYTGHENEAGQYVYEVVFLSEDGEEIKKCFQINVQYDSYEILPKDKISLLDCDIDIKLLLEFISVGSILVVFMVLLFTNLSKKIKNPKIKKLK